MYIPDGMRDRESETIGRRGVRSECSLAKGCSVAIIENSPVPRPARAVDFETGIASQKCLFRVGEMFWGAVFPEIVGCSLCFGHGLRISVHLY